MSLPQEDVLNDLCQLISTITGFQENEENYATCLRYCLSYFMHHTYPGTSKSSVNEKINNFEDRFRTYGQKKIADALRIQVDAFLSHTDLFKANPECQIEWIVLNLVSSLATNLSNVIEVPKLDPIEGVQDENVSNFFDWAAYLKVDMPTLVPELESSSDESFEELFVSADGTPMKEMSTEIQGKLTAIILSNKVDEESRLRTAAACKKALESRNKSNWLRLDKEIRGCFLQKWRDASRNQGNVMSGSETSERELVELILSGFLNPLKSFDYLVCFLTDGTIKNYLKNMQYFSLMLHELKEFVRNIESHNTSLVTIKAYSSSLDTICLDIVARLSINAEDVTLLQLSETLDPILNYLQSIYLVHKKCVTFYDEEPNWKSSLRILINLYLAFIQTTCQKLRAIFVCWFLSCLQAYLNIPDFWLRLVAFDNNLMQEFFISWKLNNDECYLHVQPFEELLNEINVHNVPFITILENKIRNCGSTLSLLHELQIKTTFSDNERSLFQEILQGLFEEYESMIDPHLDDFKKEDFAIFNCPKNVINVNDITDVWVLCGWFSRLNVFCSIHKTIEFTLLHAVSSRINQVSSLAKETMAKFNFKKHISLLKAIYLHNNSALLYPFLHTLYTKEEKRMFEYYLTNLLIECVSNDFPDLANNLTITSNSTTNDIIDFMDGLHISYQVHYPISLIINKTSIDKLNDLFVLILKLKWSHYTLCRLPLHESQNLNKSFLNVITRLRIVRFQCLSFLIRLNSYFMTQINIPLDLDGCSDLGELTIEFTQWLDKIHRRCQLADKNPCRNLIENILLPMCLKLTHIWSLNQLSNLIPNLKKIELHLQTINSGIGRLMSALESTNKLTQFL